MTQQLEAVFRTAMIAHLKKHHVNVWRIEPNFRGAWGVPDLWAFSPRLGWAGWIEVKRPWWSGKLEGEQLAFKELCDKCGINHIVCSCVEDIDKIIPPSYSSKYNHIEDWYRKNPEWRK